jgi:uncharacterized membrane protein
VARERLNVASALACFVLALVAGAADAAAELKLCNATLGRIGVSLGYQDAKGWTTEGWWNIPSQRCETLLRDSLPSRFIYVYAIDYDRGGEWTGSNLMCTEDKPFLIRGNTDCEKRGHRQTGFFEVDTGASRTWTIRLADPE